MRNKPRRYLRLRVFATTSATTPMPISASVSGSGMRPGGTTTEPANAAAGIKLTSTAMYSRALIAVAGAGDDEGDRAERDQRERLRFRHWPGNACKGNGGQGAKHCGSEPRF